MEVSKQFSINPYIKGHFNLILDDNHTIRFAQFIS